MPLGPSGNIPIKEFQTVLSKLGIFLHNYETGESFADEFWKECGYTEEDMDALKWLDLVHPEDIQKAVDAMESIQANKTDKFDVLYRVKTKKGDYRWVYNSGMFLTRNEKGAPALFLGTDRDVTDLKQSEFRLAEALSIVEKRAVELETLQAVGKSVTSVLNLQQAVGIILDQAWKVIPYKTASVQLLNDEELHIAGTKGWKSLARPWQVIPIPSDSPHSRVVKMKHPLLVDDLSLQEHPEPLDETCRSWIGVPLLINEMVLGILSFNSSPVEKFTRDHLRLAAGFGDYMAIAVNNSRNHEKMVEMATTDPLTGIHNRRWFFEAGEQIFQRARRHNRPISILMLDLDDFKKVNDSYGHAAGDEVLKAAADVFQSQIRRSDLLCRYGGEEFCVLLPETAMPTAVKIAERIVETVRTLQVSDVGRRITTSIGIACRVPDESLSFDHLVSQADFALYHAKGKGKNCASCI